MAFPGKVRIGSPFTGFPAASFNALVDGHDAQKAHKTQQTNPRFGPFTQNPRLVVRVLNSVSSDIGPGEILGFSEPLVTLSSDADQVYGIPAVKGITPAVPEHSNQFVVALDGIQGTTSTGTTGAIGPAVLMGLAWCKVNWTDNAHDKVAVAEGETKLQSSASGITPIYHGTIPGELPADVWALVLLGGGGGGASGTFVCTLSSNIGASTPGGTMTAGTGTVYSIGEDGELTEVGTRDIFNPFTCTLPSAAAQYTCAKTFEGATDADDQFTIVGPDMMQVLYSLTGSAEKTTLSLPSGETSAADIQWLGGDC